MNKVVFIINGISKLSHEVQDLLKRANSITDLVTLQILTKYRGHAKEIAEKYSSREVILVAVGGDGTAHEVVNGIMQAYDKSVFGIIPSGTGNDFLKSTSGFNPNTFIHNLKNQTSIKIDVGCFKQGDERNYFLNISDVGFGAKVIETMERQRKKGLGGKLSYSLAIARTFFNYKKSTITISDDSFSFKGKALMAVFCNGHTFGHGLQINPKAQINSGFLEVTIIGDISLFEYVRNLGKLKRGEIINHPEVHYHRITSVDIVSEGSAIHLEADGELYGTNTHEIHVISNAIRLLGQKGINVIEFE